MSTHANLEVDEYVDALLAGAIETPPVPMTAAPTPPGEPVPAAPVFHEPAFAEPAFNEPAVDKPASHEPAVGMPAYESSAVAMPSLDHATHAPGAEDRAVEIPAVEVSAVEVLAAVEVPAVEMRTAEPQPIAVPTPPKPAAAPTRDLAAFAQNIAHNVASASSPRVSGPIQTSHRWLRVVIGHDSYALELLCVQEVVRVAPIVAMRGANHAVLGVMNLRGRIVPVFDLGLWLGTACVRPDERSRIVVVEREDELIGVLVTLVEDVVTLPQHRIEPPLPGSAAGPIVGVARVGATPTVLLDAGALFG